MPDSREVWGSSSWDYMKNAVITVERLFEEDGEGCNLRNTLKSPLPMGYKSELDVTAEIGP